VAIANISVAKEVILELKDLGCRFALDDFGSGFSSFAYLKNLPVDYLKIDGYFIRDLMDQEVNQAIVASICEISKAMDRETIAEFVEDVAWLGKLRELGVDFAQGYGIGRPEPLEDFSPLPRKRRPARGLAPSPLRGA